MRFFSLTGRELNGALPLRAPVFVFGADFVFVILCQGVGELSYSLLHFRILIAF
jgi:hypothetical protein